VDFVCFYYQSKRTCSSVILPTSEIIFSPPVSSRRLVDKERDVSLLKSEVHKTIALVYCVATETLSEEYVPVGLPLLVHVFFYNARNLREKIQISYDYSESLPRHPPLRIRARQGPS
jgi:hypothetical protein